MRSVSFMASAVASLAIVAPMSRQLIAQSASPGAGAAYVALLHTPAGAFVPVPAPGMVGVPRTGPAFAIRYSRWKADAAEAVQNYGVSVSFPAGGNSAFGVTAGRVDPDCDGCDEHKMFSVFGATRLMRGDRQGRLATGIDYEIGFANNQSTDILSGRIGLLLALPLASGSARVTPYVAPGFGIGRLSQGSFSETGTRAMLGGGVAITGTRGAGIHIGAQRTFIDRGETVFGAGFVFGWPPFARAESPLRLPRP